MSDSYESPLNQTISVKNEQLADYRKQLTEKDDLLKQKRSALLIRSRRASPKQVRDTGSS